MPSFRDLLDSPSKYTYYLFPFLVGFAIFKLSWIVLSMPLRFVFEGHEGSTIGLRKGNSVTGLGRLTQNSYSSASLFVLAAHLIPGFTKGLGKIFKAFNVLGPTGIRRGLHCNKSRT